MKQEMQYIYQVYQSGSFSKAAQALYLTQPALSIAIQKVEAAIGMPLFIRDKKPLELTDAGKVYIEKVKQIMHLESELSKELSDLSSLNIGSLVFGRNPLSELLYPAACADDFSKTISGRPSGVGGSQFQRTYRNAARK